MEDKNNWYLVRISTKGLKVKKNSLKIDGSSVLSKDINAGSFNYVINFVRKELEKNRMNENVKKIKLLGDNNNFIKSYILMNISDSLEERKDLAKLFLNIPIIISFSRINTYNQHINDFLLEDDNDLENYYNDDVNKSSVKQGQLVVISDKDSSFFGYEGIIEYTKNENAWIKIGLFGKDSIIEVPISKLKSAF